jgi:hypothetical protein
MLKEIQDKFNELKRLQLEIKLILKDVDKSNQNQMNQYLQIRRFHDQCLKQALSPEEELLFNQFSCCLSDFQSELDEGLQDIYRAILAQSKSWNEGFTPPQSNDFAAYIRNLSPEELQAIFESAERAIDQFYPWLSDQLDHLSTFIEMVLPASPELQSMKHAVDTLFSKNHSAACSALEKIKDLIKKFTLVEDFTATLQMLSPLSIDQIKSLPSGEIPNQVKILHTRIFTGKQFLKQLDPVLDSAMIGQVNKRMTKMNACIDALRSEHFSRRLQRDVGVIRALHSAAEVLKAAMNDPTQIPPLQNNPGNSTHYLYQVWVHQNTELQGTALFLVLNAAEQALVQDNPDLDLQLLRRALTNAKKELVTAALKGTGYLPGLCKEGEVSKNPKPSHKAVVVTLLGIIGKLMDLVDKQEKLEHRQKQEAVLTELKNRNRLN